MPPVGRWSTDVTGGAPSGHLGNPGSNVPLLGNGYMGAVFQTAPGGSIGTHGVNFNHSKFYIGIYPIENLIGLIRNRQYLMV